MYIYFLYYAKKNFNMLRKISKPAPLYWGVILQCFRLCFEYTHQILRNVKHSFNVFAQKPWYYVVVTKLKNCVRSPSALNILGVLLVHFVVFSLTSTEQSNVFLRNFVLSYLFEILSNNSCDNRAHWDELFMYMYICICMYSMYMLVYMQVHSYLSSKLQ